MAPPIRQDDDLDAQYYDEVKRTTKSCSIHRNPGMIYTDYDTNTSYARGRVVDILQANGYRIIVPGKYLPAFDLVHYCEQIPYTVDIYALQLHKESRNVIVDELVVDIRRSKFYGLTIVPYDMDAKLTKTYVEHANDYKKQMICSQYNIDPKRYIILNEWDLFARHGMKRTDEIEQQLFKDKCVDDSSAKSRDDLYVHLPA